MEPELSPPASTVPLPAVFFLKGDRLGGRFWFMLHAWRLARKLDRKLFVLWTEIQPPEDDIRVSRILDLPSFYRSEASSDCLFIEGSPKLDLLPLHQKPGLRNILPYRVVLDPDEVEALRQSSEDILLTKSIVNYSGETEDQEDNELRELGTLLKPSREIQAQIDEVIAALGSAEYLAIHIRRGDIISTLSGQMKAYAGLGDSKGDIRSRTVLEQNIDRWIGYFLTRAQPVSTYNDAAKPFAEAGTPVLVFGDTPEINREFMEMTDLPKVKLISDFKNTLLPDQVAYLEMILLSRSERLFTTQSGFSRMAGLLGPTQIELVNHRNKHRCRDLFHTAFASEQAAYPGGFQYAKSVLEKKIG